VKFSSIRPEILLARPRENWNEAGERFAVRLDFLRLPVPGLGEADGLQTTSFHLAKRLLAATGFNLAFRNRAVAL
jgi:hypothetical protein